MLHKSKSIMLHTNNIKSIMLHKNKGKYTMLHNNNGNPQCRIEILEKIFYFIKTKENI